LRQDARDARDAEYPALASGRNAGGSDARSVFADAAHPPGSAKTSSREKGIARLNLIFIHATYDQLNGMRGVQGHCPPA